MKYLFALLLISLSASAELTGKDLKDLDVESYDKVFKYGIAKGWLQCAQCYDKPDSKECIKNAKSALKILDEAPAGLVKKEKKK